MQIHSTGSVCAIFISRLLQNRYGNRLRKILYHYSRSLRWRGRTSRSKRPSDLVESVSKLSWFLSVQLHIYIVRYSLLTHQHDVVSARTARSQGSSRNELSWGFWTMSPDRRNIYVLCTIWNFKLCRMCIDIFDLIIWQVLVTDIIHFTSSMNRNYSDSFCAISNNIERWQNRNCWQHDI